MSQVLSTSAAVMGADPQTDLTEPLLSSGDRILIDVSGQAPVPTGITRERLSDTASSGAKRRTKISIPGSVRGQVKA